MRKNYRKIPAHLAERLNTLPNQILVAAVKHVTAENFASGLHRQIGLTNNRVAVMPAVTPAAEAGRYSRYNTEGRIVVRRDLPKVDKTFTFEVPCFGDYSNMVTVTQIRQVYQRESLAPWNFDIQSEVLAEQIDGGAVVKFAITTPLFQDAPEFQRDLLVALNVLHESVGDIGIFPPATSTAEFIGQAHVHWEILPAGSRAEHIALILSKFRAVSQELKERVAERYAFFESLRPEQIIQGTYGMDGYLGALLSEGLVVFENMRDGNAVYILFGNWREISQLSKSELMSTRTFGRDYLRITHHDGWEARVRNIVELRRAG